MNLLSRSIVLLAVLACVGCASTTEITPGSIDLKGSLAASVFYLQFEDGSKGNPDNLDGYANLLWTTDKSRAKVVEAHLADLQARLSAAGFKFTQEPTESNTRACLKLKSVRYDPVGGWITDDASLSYTRNTDNVLLGTVTANERFITPTVNAVFDSLISGSLVLWGVEE